MNSSIMIIVRKKYSSSYKRGQWSLFTFKCVMLQYTEFITLLLSGISDANANKCKKYLKNCSIKNNLHLTFEMQWHTTILQNVITKYHWHLLLLLCMHYVLDVLWYLCIYPVACILSQICGAYCLMLVLKVIRQRKTLTHLAFTPDKKK